MPGHKKALGHQEALEGNEALECLEVLESKEASKCKEALEHKEAFVQVGWLLFLQLLCHPGSVVLFSFFPSAGAHDEYLFMLFLPNRLIVVVFKQVI